jgi:hypothetical protein
MNIEPDKGSNKKKPKRSPDFIVYHNTDARDANGNYTLQRRVGFAAEVKPWAVGMGEDTQKLLKEFSVSGFLEQVRDHGKMIMSRHGISHVWLVQCLGIFWRVGSLKKEGLSPFKNHIHGRKSRARDHGTAIEWWPIQRLGHPDSDIQQQRFWEAMSGDLK